MQLVPGPSRLRREVLMILVNDKKLVLLPTDKYQEIAQLLPDAKAMTLKGRPFVAVRHRVDESHILRNLGFINVPAPILKHYDWPARFAPKSHQLATSAFLTMHRRCICLNAPGTGKTMSAAWAADYLIQTGVVKRVLIIPPLTIVQRVWANELYNNLPHTRFAVVKGDRKKRSQILNDESNSICVIGHDGFTASKKFMPKFDLVIYDEATALKNPSSQRFGTMVDYYWEHAPWLWLLTGTPFSQQPTDAWALARLLGAPKLPSYNRFKDMTMRRVTTFRWEPRPEALDVCKRYLVPSIRYELDECADIPDTTYIDVKSTLTKQQAAAFKALSEDEKIASENIAAPNAAVLLAKLLQLCCGAVYNKDGEPVAFDDSDRYEALRAAIDEVGDKVIVFVPFRSVQERLQTLLTKDKYDVAVVNGDVSMKERDEIFYKFQNTSNISVLLAHPKVTSHGLTLTRSNTIIWYAPIYSLEQYEQANARIRRLNTTRKTVVKHVYATGMELELYKRLKDKRKILSDFLTLVRGENA